MRGKYISWGVILAAFILSACNSHTERPPNPQQLYDQGQQVYLEFCAECHQVDGTGWSTLYPLTGWQPDCHPA